MLYRLLLIFTLGFPTYGQAQGGNESCDDTCTKRIQGFFEVEDCKSVKIEFELVVDNQGHGTLDIKILCDGVIIIIPGGPKLPGVLS